MKQQINQCSFLLALEIPGEGLVATTGVVVAILPVDPITKMFKYTNISNKLIIC